MPHLMKILFESTNLQMVPYYLVFLLFSSNIMQIKQLSPNDLPIASHLPQIVKLIQTSPVVVISGKTGCGKSTQVPKAIWKNNASARIAVCQPRRVAATSLAIRVASEVNCKIGSNVGYHIGMQTFKSENCSIIYMTYGILIQELLFNQELPYTHIILDQIHERSLQMDFSFVALKTLMNQRRKESKSVAKLIIMSATLDSKEFAKYFSSNLQNGLFFIPTIRSNGEGSEENEQRTGRGTRRRNQAQQVQKYEMTKMDQNYIEAAMYDIPEEKKFKVEQIFWKGENLYNAQVDQQPRLSDDIVREALSVLKRLQNENLQGDVLFFLPGYFEIQMVKRSLLESGTMEERIVEVHSIFSEELYEKLFLSKVKNKLILATNIGQSSITLPFCKVVIDFCLTKKNTTRQQGINQLETRFASKASMTQRAGRVGRVADGFVFRMITQKLYETLPQYQQPEIKCISLQMVILRAKQLDYINNSKVFADPYRFLLGVMNPPNIQTIRESIQHLIHQQALLGPGAKIQQASQLELTKIGQFMVSMPCDMQISKMILMSIKLRIPKLVVSIASIMMATKMFFAHEQRRQNIEQFMHSLIGYDFGLSNDYFLRERMFNHWKQKFYYPAKDKKLYKRKIKNTQNKQTNQKEYVRNYQNNQQQMQQIFAFLQQFSQQKWSQAQKNFCFPRGISLLSMRQIVKIEQNLMLRLKNLGVAFPEEKRNLNLFLLCLTYAFPDYACQIIYSKYIKNCKKELDYVEIPYNWQITNKMIQSYVDPQKDYKIERQQKNIKVFGPPKVLKKFIFPQYFHRNSITKHVSEFFQCLAKDKISNKFECDVSHKYYQVVVLNESVNRVIIVDNYQKNYRLLTHQMNISNNRKLIKMNALIDEDTHLLIQLITIKDVEVSIHPSNQMLKSFKVGGIGYNFKRVISQNQLNIIKNLRNVAIRKNANNIFSAEEVMSQSDIQVLLNFLESSKYKSRESQPWQHTFLTRVYKNSNQNQKFYPLSYPFQFSKKKSFQKDYYQWKNNQYKDYYKFYRPLFLQEYYIICGQCQHIELIDHVSFYDAQKKLLKLNEFSGNWVQNKGDLQCSQGHCVGKVDENGQTSQIYHNKLDIYEPCNKRFKFWDVWPTKEQLRQRTQRLKYEVEQHRNSIYSFECPFCFEKDQQTVHRSFQRSYLGHNFWKKLQEHFRSEGHTSALSRYKKSLKDNS